jgi:hypothetical protein
MKSNDWFPTKRPAILAMSQDWVLIIKKKGVAVWGMSEETVAELEEAVTTVQNQMAVPKAERTSVTNVNLKNSFDHLRDVMRDIKKRYFFMPPLLEADFSSLGIKPKDSVPTPVGVPTIRPKADVKYSSKGVLELTITPAGDISDDTRMYYGCRIMYDVIPVTDEAPTNVRQLFESRFTKRKKETFIFKTEDSTKMFYFAIRYENSKGVSGEWSEIFSAVIP